MAKPKTENTYIGVKIKQQHRLVLNEICENTGMHLGAIVGRALDDYLIKIETLGHIPLNLTPKTANP